MKSFSLNIRGHLRQVDKPLIMGILNVTPDSFYSGSRTPADDRAAILDRASRLIAEGADIVAASRRVPVPLKSPRRKKGAACAPASRLSEAWTLTY